jgi:hypothetical protein
MSQKGKRRWRTRYEVREKVSAKEQEKVKGTRNEDEEGMGEASTYRLPKKKKDVSHYLKTRTWRTRYEVRE